MATEKDFTPGEWESVEAAPFMAALVVTYADLSAKRGIAEEAAAAGQAIKAGVTSSSEVVRTIASRCATGHRPAIPAIPNKPADAQAALIDGCKAAAALVSAKAPAEAAPYSRFLLDTAKACANATREGGFIGIGIQKVSEAEQSALAGLALALGLPEE